MLRLIWFTALTLAIAQDKAPPAVVPGTDGSAPSDAVVLFDGKSTANWTSRKGEGKSCDVARGEMVCRSGVGDMMTKETFGSAQIHLEFNLPAMSDKKGQLRSNSGVYVQGRYEIQILDSLDNPTYANGMAGALYGQHVPLANPSAGPSKWQYYDIVFHAPKCDASGRVSAPGSLTLLFNGVLVQDHVPVTKASGGAVSGDLCAEGPLLLQDHSGFKDAPMTELRFRNIWARRLKD
jgi:hypothetical protein